MVATGGSEAKPSVGRRVVDALIGIGIAATLLGLGEITLRLTGFEFQFPTPIIFRIADGYRFHPQWFWEPIPGAPVEQCEHEVINAAGYRGPERPTTRRPGTFRIVTLGDSSTFGTLTCDDRAYPFELERLLPDSEVLNFGVIGYTAFQGARLLDGRAIAYRPDLVVAAFGAINEARPALGLDVEARYAITSRVSPTAMRVRDELAPLRLFQFFAWATGAAGADPATDARRAGWGEAMRHARPGEYHPNETVESFERSLERIAASARHAGAQVAFVVPPRRRHNLDNPWLDANPYPNSILRTAARLDVPIYNVDAVMHLRSDGDAVLLRDSIHPTIKGHQVYAEFLAKRILGSRR